MSRHTHYLNDNISVTSGSDPYLGYFIQIQDDRYAGTPQDEQGEGYVYDIDNLFGEPNINLIGLDINRKTSSYHGFSQHIIKLCDEFINQIPTTS